MTTCGTTWSSTRKTRSSGAINYAIVDEVDSILIDEARTPLIISGQGDKSDRPVWPGRQPLPGACTAIRVKETDDKEDNDELYEDYDYIVDEKAEDLLP